MLNHRTATFLRNYVKDPKNISAMPKKTQANVILLWLVNFIEKPKGIPDWVLFRCILVFQKEYKRKDIKKEYEVLMKNFMNILKEWKKNGQ